jgi:hypothetical protein
MQLPAIVLTEYAPEDEAVLRLWWEDEGVLHYVGELAIGGDDRGGGVEPQPQLTTYQRMIEGARIRDRVVDHVRALGAERRRAQSRFRADLRDTIQSLGRGEPDPVGVDDADRGDRGAAHRCGGRRDGVELAVGWSVEDLVTAYRS